MDDFLAAVNEPYKRDDLLEISVHNQSLVALSRLYLLPEINKPLRVIELTLQQLHGGHISSKWLVYPSGPLSCIYGRAVLLLADEQHDDDDLSGCTFNSANHTYFHQREQKERLNEAEADIEQNPDQIEGHRLLSLALLRLGFPARSLATVKVALGIQKDDLTSLLLCGEAAEQLSLIDEAGKCYVAAYDKLRSTSPDMGSDQNISSSKRQVHRGLLSLARQQVRQKEFPQAYLTLLRCRALSSSSQEQSDLLGSAISIFSLNSSP